MGPTPTPQPDRVNQLASSNSIDDLCCRFRASWLNGERINAESFLAQLSKEQRTSDCVIEVVCTEILVRRELGESVSLNEYRQRFPELAATLEMQLCVYDALLPLDLPGADEEPPDSPPGPPLIAGYQLTQLLGQGATGSVYQAWHERSQRFVALKVLRPEGMADEHARARFRVEAHAVAHLQHPSIVQLYEVGVGAPIYLAMELAEGGTLAQTLAAGPLEPSRATEVLITLARAIQYAHERGVLHRDLKPANVLLTSSGTLKLTDFGLAKRLDVDQEQTRTGTIIGTPGYMAPEQASGRVHDIGTTSDVYSLGAILYHCLTGVPPFRGATAMETLLQVIEQDPVSPRDKNAKIPRDLSTICVKCLQKQPQRRYSSAATLADDLVRFRDGIPIRARPVGYAEKAIKWVRRHPTKALLFASTCVLVIALTSAGMFLNNQSQARIQDARNTLSGVLKRSADLRHSRQWSAAEELLSQSQPLLKDAISPPLEQQIGSELAQVKLAAALERVRFRRKISGDAETGLDARGVLEGYQQVFEDFGWDVNGQLADIATQMEASLIRDQFVAALDDWAFAANEAQKSDQCQQLLAIVRRIDRDPWRDEVRNSKFWNNRDYLERLGREVKGNEPLSMIAFLATLMIEAGADAEPLLRKIYQSHPDDPDINWQLGTVLFRKGQHVQAAGFFRAVLASRPRNSSAFGRLGDSLLAIEQTDEAIAAYQSAIEIEPNSGWFLVNLGHAYRSKKMLDEELAAYRQAIKVDPDGNIPRECLGLALMDAGELDEAVESFRLALERRKDSAVAHNGLAYALVKQNKSDEAIAELRAGIEANPSFAALHLSLANELFVKERFEEAAAEYRRTIEIEPKGVLAYINLISTHTQLKQFADAFETAKQGCKQVARNDPRFAALEDQLRVCEQVSEADKRLSRFLKDPTTKLSNIERVLVGHFSYFYKRDYRTGAQLLKEALTLEPVLGSDVRSRYRFAAACSAVLYALEEANTLSEPERLEYLRLARQWLRADIDDLADRASKPNYNQASLTGWLNEYISNSALERVRRPQNVIKIPPDEQTAWDQLHADTLELAGRIPHWWLDKGLHHAERKEWSDAAHCYSRAFALQEPTLSDPWFEYAAVQLLAGDLKAYDETCNRFLDRARETQLRPYHVARAFTLGASHKVTFAEITKFADPELSKFENKFWSLTEQGALACRRGDPTEARKLLERSSRADRRPGCTVLNWLWLALASHKAGDAKQAQAWLRKSRTWLAAHNDGHEGDDAESLGTHFHNYLEGQILLHETTRLIGARPIQ